MLCLNLSDRTLYCLRWRVQSPFLPQIFLKININSFKLTCTVKRILLKLKELQKNKGELKNKNIMVKKTTKEINLPCSLLARVTNRSYNTIKQHTLLIGDTALSSREFLLQLSSKFNLTAVASLILFTSSEPGFSLICYQWKELKVDHILKLCTNKRNTEVHNLIFSTLNSIVRF